MREVIYDLPSEVYHAHRRLSASGMRNFLRSPRYYKAMLERPRESTPSMTTGTLLHTAILEPLKFAARYMPTDLERRGTKEWKTVESLNPGKELVKAPEYAEICECRRVVIEDETVARLLNTGDPKAEVSIFWEAEFGVKSKARLDLIAPHSHLVDLKFTHECDKFMRTAYPSGYHVQAAWYLRAAIAAGLAEENTPFYFVAVEPSYPFEMRVYHCSDEFIAAGNSVISEILPQYASCEQDNKWPGNVGPWKLDVPNYARSEHE